jgi:uncharacterized protein (DUF58 family)
MKEDHRLYLTAGEQAGSRFTLSAPRRVPLGIPGVRAGNRVGSSLEFKDHREYEPGDDLRRIDWNSYARTDKLILKLYQEEVSPHVDLVIDGSRSMALEESSKLEATLGLAAVFAVAAANAGFTHSVWLAHDACRKIEGGGDRPSLWRGLTFDYKGDVSESFARLRPAWRRQGIRILVSDLLWLGDPLVTLQYMARDSSAVIVVQVLARSDADPPQRGNIRLVDSETEQTREIFVDAGALQRYKEALGRHSENWQLACRQAGAIMTTIVAEATIGDWKLEELVARGILNVGA